MGRERPGRRGAEECVSADAAVAVDLRAEHARVLHREQRALADSVDRLCELGEFGGRGRERDLCTGHPEILRSRGGDERADARVRAVGANEKVAGRHEAICERELMLPTANGAHHGQGMAPPHEVGRNGVEEELAEDSAVDLGAEILRALGRATVLAAELEVEGAGAVADPHVIAFRTGVLGELVLEAVLAEGALPALPPEVEGAAQVGTGVEAGIALVERR